MAQGTATERAARQPPAGFELELQEAAATAEGAAHHHLRTRPGTGGQGHQHSVAVLIHHAQAVHRGQIGVADPHRVTVGIDVAAADAAEIKAAEQGVHHRRAAGGHREAGAPAIHLFIDIQLGAAAATDRRRHHQELLGIEFSHAEQRRRRPGEGGGLRGLGPRGQGGGSDRPTGQAADQGHRRGPLRRGSDPAGEGKTHGEPHGGWRQGRIVCRSPAAPALGWPLLRPAGEAAGS